MTPDHDPQPTGHNGVTVQIGPCLAGHLRTWTRDGDSRLWSTPDAEWLSVNQATGRIARTERDKLRWREIATLEGEPDGDTATLVLAPRGTPAGDPDATARSRSIRLDPVDELPGDIDRQRVVDDLVEAFTRSIRHCITSGEYLVVEQGGWAAPATPNALFARVQRDDEPVNLVETAPVPADSELWGPPPNPDARSVTVTAPATLDATDAVPWLLLDAIDGWGVPLHDLGLTFLRH